MNKRFVIFLGGIFLTVNIFSVLGVILQPSVSVAQTTHHPTPTPREIFSNVTVPLPEWHDYSSSTYGFSLKIPTYMKAYCCITPHVTGNKLEQVASFTIYEPDSVEHKSIPDFLTIAVEHMPDWTEYENVTKYSTIAGSKVIKKYDRENSEDTLYIPFPDKKKMLVVTRHEYRFNTSTIVSDSNKSLEYTLKFSDPSQQLLPLDTHGGK